MFSAVYLVCFSGQPCVFYVDPAPYESFMECMDSATENIARNNYEIEKSGVPVPTVDLQCISFEKA